MITLLILVKSIIEIFIRMLVLGAGELIMFVSIAIFIVLFISTSIIEKNLKSIKEQNEAMIKILTEIKENQQKG